MKDSLFYSPSYSLASKSYGIWTIDVATHNNHSISKISCLAFFSSSSAQFYIHICIMKTLHSLQSDMNVKYGTYHDCHGNSTLLNLIQLVLISVCFVLHIFYTANLGYLELDPNFTVFGSKFSESRSLAWVQLRTGYILNIYSLQDPNKCRMKTLLTD